MDVDEAERRGPAGFAASSLLGLVLLTLVGSGFGVLLALVAAEWEPLHKFDVAAVDALNAALRSRGWAVAALQRLTDLGGTVVAWLVFATTAVWLLVRRLPAIALFVVVTGLGAEALETGIKTLVDRARPVVDEPVASAAGLSFPSGHALGATVTYGMLLLVFLPAVPARWRRRAIGIAAALVAVVNLTRVALGVHYPSDVVAGTLLGILWLAVTATAFRHWSTAGSADQPLIPAGLAPAERPALRPAPDHTEEPDDRPGWDRPVPGLTGVATLLVGWVLIWGALVGLGFLLTDVLTAVQQFDQTIVEWFVSVRTDTLTTVAVAVGHLGSTSGVLALTLVSAALSSAVLRRWRAPLFLVVAVVGESLLFLATSTVVDRLRPAVDYLSPTLPPTSSYPSGHAAAAMALHGGVGLLIVAWSNRNWLRSVAMGWIVLVPALVALSRLYRGVHHPSDVVVSVLYAAVWLAFCWHAIAPGPAPPSAPPTGLEPLHAQDDVSAWAP